MSKDKFLGVQSELRLSIYHLIWNFVQPREPDTVLSAMFPLDSLVNDRAACEPATMTLKVMSHTLLHTKPTGWRVEP